MSHDTLIRILDLARWAPSGGNTQPWRFEIANPSLIRVHGSDTRDHIFYDFDGHASHIAHGALLETLRIAASGFGLAASWQIVSHGDDRQPIYDVALVPDKSLAKDQLFACIKARTVQRRLMKTTSLTDTQRQALRAAGGEGFRVDLFEDLEERWQIAQMLYQSAKIRLTCPEAFSVHTEIVEWRTRYSKDRIPGQAVGVAAATARLTEWVMQSWDRVQFFNRYLLYTVWQRIQQDLLPAVFCAAHVLVRPRHDPICLADWVQLGGVMQRIWLTSTLHGLHLQPQMTPVIFRWYARLQRHFSTQPELLEMATAVSDFFEYIAFTTPEAPFGFFCRVGVSRSPQSRSTRLDLADLMVEPGQIPPGDDRCTAAYTMPR
jgi:hypothetical protein